MIAVNKENNIDINHFKEQVLKQKQIEENLEKQQNELETIKKEILSQKYMVGKKFNECIEFLEDELNNIKEDKRIEKICAFVESIKTIHDDLHEIKEALIMMSDVKEDISCSENKDSQDDKDYPLPLSKQFSAYEMYNRKGFSMKDFSIKHKKDFITVYNHFDKDIEKTIEYLQKRHGLCSSIYIDPRSFKNKYFPSI